MVGRLILPNSNRRRLLSSLMSSHSCSSETVDNFKLKSTKEFASRSQNIFQELRTLEEKYEMRTSLKTDEQVEKSDHTLPSCSVSGLSGVFKVPNPVSSSRKRKSIFHTLPNHKKHSQKWTKYSLADTPNLSDESNRSAAMQFLAELRNRKNQEQLNNVHEDKLRFHKPYQKNNSSSQPVKSSFVQTRNVMPDCIVGKKSTIVKKSKGMVESKTLEVNNVKLDHLEEILDEVV